MCVKSIGPVLLLESLGGLFQEKSELSVVIEA